MNILLQGYFNAHLPLFRVAIDFKSLRNTAASSLDTCVENLSYCGPRKLVQMLIKFKGFRDEEIDEEENTMLYSRRRGHYTY